MKWVAAMSRELAVATRVSAATVTLPPVGAAAIAEGDVRVVAEQETTPDVGPQAGMRVVVVNRRDHPPSRVTSSIERHG